jgi:hypothetical protein
MGFKAVNDLVVVGAGCSRLVDHNDVQTRQRHLMLAK